MVHKVEVNLESLYRSFGEGSEVVMELIRIFLRNKPLEVEDLTNAIEERNWEQARQVAHKLKSGYRMMGMTSLISLAELLEKESSKEETCPDQMGKNLVLLQGQSEEAYEILKAILKENE